MSLMNFPLPTGYDYGLVVARFILAVGDTTTDPDNLPEAQGATGTVEFTSVVRGKTVPQTPPPSIGVSHKTIICGLDQDGYLLDPAGNRGVWLWSGEWTVVYKINDEARPSHNFLLTAANDAENPLDLLTVAPPVPGPGITLQVAALPVGAPGDGLGFDGSGLVLIPGWLGSRDEVLDAVAAASTSASTATTKASEASTAAATATTKASEAAASASTAANLLNNSVRHDIAQSLSAANQLRARTNIGLGTRSMGNDIVGAGRPDISATMDADTLARVNAATSGMTFYSTDGPQGAWVWRKRGATWVCVEGDTGAVNASALLAGGSFELVSVAPVFTVRREPTRIFYAGRLQLRADSPQVGNNRQVAIDVNPVPLPTGWFNDTTAYGVYVSIGNGITSGSTPLVIGTYATSTKLRVTGMAGQWAAGDPVSFTAQNSIPATLAWPTTLTI